MSWISFNKTRCTRSSFLSHQRAIIRNAKKLLKENEKLKYQLLSVEKRRQKELKLQEQIKQRNQKRALTTCFHCGSYFRNVDRYNLHIKDKICKMTKEERKKRQYARCKETQLNKSDYEKAQINQKIVSKIHHYRQNMTEEDKKRNSNNIRNSCNKFYQSEQYDSNIRGEQIKRGLLNAKDKKD